MKISSTSILILLVVSIDLSLSKNSDQSNKVNPLCKKKTERCVCDSIICPNVTSLPGAKGEKGLPGLDGLPGQDGTKGDKGAKGVGGHPGSNGKDGINGEKGDKGDVGLPGVSGSDGIKGEPGEKGEPGSKGLPGVQGPKGEKGLAGNKGSSGKEGDKGQKGTIGDPGEKGNTGNEGPKGIQGLIGPPGSRGPQGRCTCPGPIKNNDEEGTDIARTPDGEYARACKYMRGAKDREGTFRLSKDGTEDAQFEVYCRKGKTCLKPQKKKQDMAYNTFTPFMLSTQQFDYRYDIEKDALLSLQRLSNNAEQNITIYCMNSYVYEGEDGDYKSRSISFVAWNDIMLRSYPTDDNPFQPYIVEEDGCKNSTKNEKFTKFELVSDKAERLPITDILVGDVRGEVQHLSVELHDLCFD